eukprot:scaffold795_cov187-Amphora_coffeaeformis.AAC.2
MNSFRLYKVSQQTIGGRVGGTVITARDLMGTAVGAVEGFLFFVMDHEERIIDTGTLTGQEPRACGRCCCCFCLCGWRKRRVVFHTVVGNDVSWRCWCRGTGCWWQMRCFYGGECGGRRSIILRVQRMQIYEHLLRTLDVTVEAIGKFPGG